MNAVTDDPLTPFPPPEQGPQNSAIERWLSAVDTDPDTVTQMLAELLHQYDRRSEDSFHLRLDALENLFLTLHSMTLTDELTRIYNRRGFLRAGAQRLKSWGDSGQGALLLCIDVDNLKAVNDSLGHAAGDELLTRTAQVLRDAVGHGDVLGRLGGDEFAALIPLTVPRSIPHLLMRLREAIDAGNASHPGSTLSLTAGCVEFDPSQPLTLTALLHKADRAMYASKQGALSKARGHESGPARHGYPESGRDARGRQPA